MTAAAINTEPTIRTTPEFLPLYDKSNPHYYDRFLTFYGGRAARKSWEIAKAILLRAMEEPIRILCAREYQNSISDSVLNLLQDRAVELGIDCFFDFQRNAIIGANRSEFIFRGLARNITSLKSLEDIAICWVEEGQTVSEASWRILIPTIRKPGSQIITSFNTGEESDPTFQRLVINPDPGSYVCKVTYLDNPDCPEEVIRDAERMKRLDPEAFANIYLGEPWTRTDSQVLADRWRVGEMEPDLGRDSLLMGADFGFSVDPSTLLRFWVIGRELDNNRNVVEPGTLYIEAEAYAVGVEIEDKKRLDYEKFYQRVEGSKETKIRGDNARPEVISHIRKKGYNIVPCKKWSGSVEDGISLLRSFDEIVINPSCKETIAEARNWRYKTDRLTGEVLSVLVDANNHCFDAIRYGLEPLIKPTKDISMRVA